MSTRCYIGIENKDKTVDYIYCHHDGYIDGVGKTLLEHYQDETKIRKLMALGRISSLGYEPMTRPTLLEAEEKTLFYRAVQSGNTAEYWDWREREYDRYCDAYDPDDWLDPVRQAENRKLYESEAASDIEYIYLYTKTGWKVFKSGGFRSYKIN